MTKEYYGNGISGSLASPDFERERMREIDPKETTRAFAFEAWINAPMPMVTLFKTLDVTRLRKVSSRKGMRFNMLMCWCIGRAASKVKEFYVLPVNGRLIQYDTLAVNTIVMNRDGGVSSCDVPFSNDLATFSDEYLRLTRHVAESCENHDMTDSMVIGTSALAQYDIDGAMILTARSVCTAASITIRS